MKRNYFIFIFLVLGLIILSPKIKVVSAQTPIPSNTFDCRDFSGSCQPINGDCLNGCNINSLVCLSSPICNSTINNNCSCPLGSDCWGDSGPGGGIGTCTAVMDCSPAGNKGQGSCNGPGICCIETTPPPGGDCGDPCNGPSDCGNGLQCTGGLCNGSICPLCTGNSGYTGVCLESAVCSAKFRTEDEPSACVGSSICCTDAPPTDSCTLTPIGPFYPTADFEIILSAPTLPNTTFNYDSTPTCLGNGLVTTDSTGEDTHIMNCPPGTITISASAGSTTCSTVILVNSGGGGTPTPPPGGTPLPTAVPTLSPSCITSSGDDGINTAIGCIPVSDSTIFTAFLLRWALGIGGGVALLLMSYAGIMISTSAGDPQKLQAGKELLTAAIAGLILLLFSVFVLELIGVRIFNLPGF